MINSQQRFRVVFVGEFDSKRDLERIKKALVKRYNLTPPILERLLAGRPIVVKNNVDADEAYRYKTEFSQLGCISRIEPMPVFNDVDERGFIERRKSERRIRNDRRGVSRTDIIYPDRRRGERRKANRNGKKPSING